MNQKIILPMILSLALSGCVLPDFGFLSSDKIESSDSIINNESNVASDSSTIINQPSNADSNSSSNKPSSSITIDVSSSIKPNNEYSIKIGDYGDYMTTINKSKTSSELMDIYEDLSVEIESSKNGIIKTKYQKGLQEFFSIDNKVGINVDIKKDELLKINEYHNKSNEESYRICDVDITINDLVFHYEDVGIRLKGNTSRGLVVNQDNSYNLRHYKLNFKETFDDEFRDDVMSWTDDDAFNYRDERSFFGLEKVDIRWNKNEESTYIREYYAYEMYRNNGLLAPHTNPFNLSMTIDNVKHNAGVYLAVEPIDKDFLKKNLAKEYRNGDLYKMGWTSVGATLDNTDSSLFGEETQYKNGNSFSSYKYPYDIKTNKKETKHEDIKRFINLLNDTSASNFESMLKENTKYDMLMKFFAVSYLLSDPDDLRGNFNNTYLYFIPKTDTTNALAVFIPTDHDRALASTGGSNPLGHHGVYSKPFDNKTGYSENNMPLYKKTILNENNTVIRNDYLNAIKNVLDSKFMDINTFKVYYNKAYNHYSNNTKLSDKFSNNDISFSLKETDNIYDNWNLSIEVFLKEKLKTVSSYIDNENNGDNNNNEENKSFDIIFHYYSDNQVYNELDTWTWSWKNNQSGQAMPFDGSDENGAYIYLNSNNYENPNNIGFIVRTRGTWDYWQTNSHYFDMDDFLKDEDGITHIYSCKNENNDLMLYTSSDDIGKKSE